MKYIFVSTPDGAAEQFAESLFTQHDGALILEDPYICLPESFDLTKLEKRESKAMDDKHKKSMAVLAIAAAGLFPQHLLGVRPAKAKRLYEACAGCGNPTKDATYCHKCRTKG